MTPPDPDSNLSLCLSFSKQTTSQALWRGSVKDRKRGGVRQKARMQEEKSLHEMEMCPRRMRDGGEEVRKKKMMMMTAL